MGIKEIEEFMCLDSKFSTLNFWDNFCMKIMQNYGKDTFYKLSNKFIRMCRTIMTIHENTHCHTTIRRKYANYNNFAEKLE